MGFFDKLKERMGKTRTNISNKINNVIKSFRKVDEDFFEELEEALILSDIGVATTDKVMNRLRDYVKENKISDPEEIKKVLIDTLAGYMDAPPLQLPSPTVLLVVGVNGVGKGHVPCGSGGTARYLGRAHGYTGH